MQRRTQVKNTRRERSAKDRPRKSEPKLSTLIANLPGVVFRVRNDPNYTVEYVSDNVAELTGYPADDFRQNRRNFGDLMHPDDRERVWEETQRALKEHRSYQVTYRFIDAHGNVKWNWERGVGVFDEKGRLEAIEGFVQDITEHKRVEEELRTSNRQWLALVETMPDYMGLYDPEGHVQFLNHYPEGYSAKDVVGKHYSVFLPEASRALYDQAFDTILRKGKMEFLEYAGPGDKGVLRTYNSYFVPIFEGNRITKIMVVARDITERKQAEEALHKSEQTFSVIFKKAPFAAGLAKIPDGAYLKVNEEFERLFGFTQDEIIGKTSLELGMYPDRDVRERAAELFRKQGYVHDLDVRLQTKNGKIRDMLINSDLIEIGGVKYILTTANDVTERKRVAEALNQSEERLRLSTELAHVAVWEYDFRTNKMSRSRNHDRLYGLEWQETWDINTFLNATHPDDRQHSLEAIQRSVTPGGPNNYSFDFRVMHSDQSIHWLNVIGQVVERNAIGEGLVVRGCLLEITERKRAEEERRLSEERFSKAFFSSPAGMTLTRIADGTFIDVNDSFLRLFEFTRAEVLGHTSTELRMLTPEERQKLIHQQIQSGGLQNVELQARTKSGRIVSILFSSKPIELEGEACLITTMIDVTERKRAEEALIEREHQLSTLLRNLPGLAYRCRNDANFTTEFVSDGVAGVTGYPAEDFHEHRVEIRQLIHPDDREQVEKEVKAALKEDRPFELIYRIKSATREEKWIWERGTGIKNAKGEVGWLEGFVTDITERKRTEETLRENEQRLSSIFDTVGDVIYDLAVESEGRFRFRSVNSAFSRITGLSQEQVVGKTVAEIIPEPSLTMVLEKYRQAIETGAIVRWEETSDYPTGRLTGEVSVAPVFDEHGRCTHLVGSVHDITERNRAEEALRMSQQKLSLALRASNLGTWLANVETAQFEADTIAKVMHGFEPDEAITTLQQGNRYIHPDDVPEIQRRFETAVKTRGIYENEYRVVLPNGETRWVHSLGSVQQDTPHLIGVVQDITERKKAEEEIHRSNEQLRALTGHLQTVIEVERERIAREIHDDIGQILTAAKMDLSLLEKAVGQAPEGDRKTPVTEEIRSLIGLLDQGLISIRKVVRDLRPEVLETMGLAAGIQWQASEFKKRTGIHVSLSLPQALNLDKRQTIVIFRVIQEALTNIARHAEAANVTITVENNPPEFRVRVRDDGKGISPGSLGKPDSFGLLAMRERVNSIGGSFLVYPNAKNGTTLEVTLLAANGTSS